MDLSTVFGKAEYTADLDTWTWAKCDKSHFLHNIWTFDFCHNATQKRSIALITVLKTI